MKDDVRLWLESYRELKFEADRLWRKHQQLMSQATRVTTQLSPTPGRGGGDKEQLLAALADADDEVIEKSLAATERMREIEKFIDSIPTAVCRVILRLRYIELLHWKDLERRLKKSGTYSYEQAQIFRLHGAALREARELWDSRKERE